MLVEIQIFLDGFLSYSIQSAVLNPFNNFNSSLVTVPRK